MYRRGAHSNRSEWRLWFRGIALLIPLVLFGACRSGEADLDLPETVDFNYHIRPILSNNCYVCHGPDVSTREAGLRLDTREGATTRREEGGAAIRPGRAGASLLIHRVTAADPEERMPPAVVNKVLSPREIALLQRWIDQGAEYKEHWSLIAPSEPVVPSVTREGEAVGGIDAFVLARLDARGLAPASSASREALIRRLSYVLTGLPPSPEAVQAFVADEAPDAYEQLVDRLLASPHFGERWARHWMDLVRYADSKGHEFDYTIQGAWRYRDYLIRAFNADVPYDQFVTEHLAGDLIDTPRRHPEAQFNESVLGTAFYGLGEGKHSPVDLREDEADRINNIIDVTTKTFQGLTVACARCHDHKFDPIPTTDYYALYGIFESTRFAPMPLHTPVYQARVDSIRALKADLRRHLAAQWMEEGSTTPVQLVALPAPSRDSSPSARPASALDTTAFRVLGDFRDGHTDGWFTHGPAFDESFEPGVPLLEQGRLAGLTSGVVSSRTWAKGVPGALRSPTFTIAHDTIAVVASGAQSVIRIVIDNFQLIRYPIHGGLEQEIDHPEPTTFRFDVAMWKGSKAYIELLVGTYDKSYYISEQHLLRDTPASYFDAAYAIAYTGEQPEMPPASSSEKTSPEAVASAIRAWARGSADAGQVALLDGLVQRRRLNPSLEAIAPQVASLQGLAARLGNVPYFAGVTEGDAVESPVFERGSFKRLGPEPVPHRFFTALDPEGTPFITSPSGRLDLARAMTDPANPLTARVMVNRLWHHVFGHGLVETVDNFGAQGKLPTHPALLDYLALRFVEEGWSMKAMIREMVLSHTFRQASQGADRAATIDPENLLWHHYPVRRLEGEAIRDGILAVSGRLDSTMYGEPVPIHLTAFMTGRGRPEASGPLDGAGRRSLYTAVRRNFLWPMMLAFDLPIPFSTFGRRNSSNVPAQSLTLLNDPFVDEQAAVWADALVALPHRDPQERITHIYLTALSRLPTDEEQSSAVQFVRQQARHYGVPAEGQVDDPRPWADYCHVVFNLKEFIYLV